MKEENKTDKINDSLNFQKDINNINIQEGEKENKDNNDINISNLNSDKNINNNIYYNNIEKNVNEDIINNIEILNNNYTTKRYNTDDILKKINSQKVNLYNLIFYKYFISDLLS